MKTRGITIAFLMLMACVAPAQNTAPGCGERSIRVTVTDARGTPVLGLDKTAFRIEGNASLTILDAKPMLKVPYALLMIDVSASMLGSHEAATVKRLAESIIEAAPPGSPFAVMTFAERIGEQAGFTAPKNALSNVVTRIAHNKEYIPIAGIRTAWRDAVIEGASSFPETSKNNVLFLITDGGDNVSRASDREVKQRLLEKNVRIFPILLRQLVPPTIARGGEDLPGLSQASGAEAFSFGIGDDLAKIRQAGQYAYRLSSTYYSLQIGMPEHLEKRTKVRIQVTGTDGKKLFAYYPHELLPRAEKTAGN